MLIHRIALVITLVFAALGVWAEPIRIDGGTGGSALEKLAVEELRWYLEKMFVDGAVVADEARPRIVLGTQSSNPRIAEAIGTGAMSLPRGPNSDQGYVIKTIDGVIFITGRTPVGVLYGVYELLERYGVYFMIDGERLPQKTAYKTLQLDINECPVFKYRGLLPWDNFLCGMSGYNLQDYKQLIDRATRMKLNMLQFHFYPGMAFFTEEWNGQPVNPSCIGMPVDVFGTAGSIGESAFGDLKVFGPEPYVKHMGNPRAQAEAVQSMMRRVLDYARGRGWKTCVGFELMYPNGGGASFIDKPNGFNYMNPLDPNNAELSVHRLRTLMRTYPNSDYYWMWQSEARGFYGREVGREPGATKMRDEFAHWSPNADLAGDIDYAYAFLEVVKRLSPEERSRLATGGWSVEHLFPGLHPDMPEEIIFASLNAYHPPTALENQISSYRVAKDGRRAWMIDWWEFDGNQWFPQFRCGWQERMYEKCVEFGVEGVTLLGWKLSGVGQNIRYLSEFAWDPELGTDEFYADYVRRVYGDAAASVASVFKSYDEYEPVSPPANSLDYRVMLLGAGWTALEIPAIPMNPEHLDGEGWQRNLQLVKGLLPQHEKLLDMDRAAVRELKRVLPRLDEGGRSWAKLMINRLEFRMLYVRSMMALNSAYLEFDRICREQKIELAGKAAAQLTAGALELARKAIEHYASDIRDRGDLGVVAQLNEQYYKPILAFHTSLSGETSPYVAIDSTAFRLTPKIRFDFSSSSAWKHRDGTVRISTAQRDGHPALRLQIGGDGTQYNSAWIWNDVIDLGETPVLDFKMRTTSREPLAILFQAEHGEAWYALNLVGRQSRFPQADGLPNWAVNDGAWHRVTWNLANLCKERLGGIERIRNVVVGVWDNPAEAVDVEFADFAFGVRNSLD